MSKAKKDDTTDATAEVTLAHGIFVDGEYVGPGTKVTLSKADAAGLTAGGYVVTDGPVGEVDSGAAGT